MTKVIKIRCNGSGKCLNEFTEIDLEKYTRPTIVVRGQPKHNLPERLVINCQHCSEGKIVITRKMMEEL